MEAFAIKNGLSLRVYKGDAMTLLAFDLDEEKLENFIGFTIHVNAKNLDHYLLNRLSLPPDILAKNHIKNDSEKLSSLYSPFQKFNWVHVPSTDHNINTPYFGDYTYTVSARYLTPDGILQPISPQLTVELTIDVSPFQTDGTRIGFTRGFMSSEAYVRRFGMNNHLRPLKPKKGLIFNIASLSGSAKAWDYSKKMPVNHTYTYEDQHKYLGWQARERIMEFLDETLGNSGMSLEVFAYDLDEPVVVDKLLKLAESGRLKIILDNSGTHADPAGYEGQFEKLFNGRKTGDSAILRGKFKALSHSKIFIQKKGGNAVKVLTGSINFSTNGMYINANHVIIFDQPEIAALYSRAFDKSFGLRLMADFDTTDLAQNEFTFGPQGKETIVHFSPHNKEVATRLFKTISSRISDAKSDVLFAIMDDSSKSSILDAVRKQIGNEQIFTYGITDTISKKTDSVVMYKPNSRRGIRVAAKGVINVLPKPFDTVPGTGSAKAIHHKFVVVDFKGSDPVVYCGSSNLAFVPEQRNGDNLLEIRDRDIVTVFAIEAFRLTDHFQWRNRKPDETEIFLDKSKGGWYKKYYNANDLRSEERKLFIKDNQPVSMVSTPVTNLTMPKAVPPVAMKKERKSRSRHAETAES